MLKRKLIHLPLIATATGFSPIAHFGFSSIIFLLELLSLGVHYSRLAQKDASLFIHWIYRAAVRVCELTCSISSPNGVSG